MILGGAARQMLSLWTEFRRKHSASAGVMWFPLREMKGMLMSLQKEREDGTSYFTAVPLGTIPRTKVST